MDVLYHGSDSASSKCDRAIRIGGHSNDGILTLLVFRVGGWNNQRMREDLDFAGSNKFRFSLSLPNGKRLL